MAHGRYHCCAICDSKIAYGDDSADSKGMICPLCMADMSIAGVTVRNVTELLGWIWTEDADEVQRVLLAAGFRQCFYNNAVDKAVKDKGLSIG